MRQAVNDLLHRVRDALQGRYLVEREVGRGAAAAVFLAEDRKHHRPVALKVLLPEVVGTMGSERFIREIETVARLSHPHILPLFDSGEVDGLPYFVMPFAAGETLRDRIARERQLPLEDALQITREVASALGYAHGLGIVHRDIKPANILLTGGHAVVADFGVARAISAARDGDAGEGGELFGTPLYMSPEQLSGEARLDGRSDLYSLGCVLHEMLAGRPPFEGPTLEALRQQHLLEPPASLRSYGRELPAAVEELVRILLAKAPADRFVTAHQFLDRLPTPQRLTPVSGAASVPEAGRRRRPWLVAAGIAAGLMIAGTAAARLTLTRALDGDRYVLLGTEGALAGQDSKYLAAVQQEMQRWTDIQVASPLEVFDAVQRAGEAPTALPEAMDLARELGAANLVRVRQRLVADSIVLEAVRYDLRRGERVVLDARVSIPSTETQLGPAAAALTERLLLGARGNHALAGRPVTSRSVRAIQAFDAGIDAVGAARLDEAAEQFRRAVIADNGFAEALLWYAQTLWLRGDGVQAWREAASALMADPGRLSAPQAALARGLAALADGRFPDACDEFDALVAQDSSDFVAWFARGECHALDRTVVPDAASPSGHAFRGSFETAIASYERALRGLPSVHLALGARPFERLARMFWTRAYQIRTGQRAADSLLFAAWPALQGDTLAFVPWPANALVAGEAGAGRPASQSRALLRNRSRLAELTAAWVRAFPQSARAHQVRGLALETVQVGGPPGVADEAIGQLRSARRLAASDAERAEIAVDEVRQLLKQRRFAAAAVLADSALAWAGPRPDSSAARRLAGVAAVTGRPAAAAALLRQVSVAAGLRDDRNQLVTLPATVLDPALALLAFAAVGGPADSLARLAQQVEQRIRSDLPPAEQPAAREAALTAPAFLTYGRPGLTPRPRDDLAHAPYLRLQALHARGDLAAARALFADLAGSGEQMIDNDVAVDGVLALAEVGLALGQRDRVIDRIDRTLTSFETLSPALLGSDVAGSVPMAGALPRLMALRATLAAEDGDRVSARTWAGAVLDLWRSAEPALAAERRRLEQIRDAVR